MRVKPSYLHGFARNAAESAYPNLWRGLVGLWCATIGPTGNTLRDFSGRSQHAAMTNMEPSTDWVINGNSGYAVSLDGADEYMTVDNSAVLTPSRDLTVLAWLAPTGDGTFRHPVINPAGASWVPPYARYAIRVDNTNKVSVWVEDLANVLTSTQTILEADGMRPIGLRYDGANLAIFIDGVKESESSLVTSITATSQPLYFGTALPAVGNKYEGLMSAVYIYDRALTENEMRLISLRPSIALERRARTAYSVPAVAGLSIPIAAYHHNHNIGAHI